MMHGRQMKGVRPYPLRDVKTMFTNNSDPVTFYKWINEWKYIDKYYSLNSSQFLKTILTVSLFDIH